MNRKLLRVSAVLLVFGYSSEQVFSQEKNENRWEKTIQNFEVADKDSPPPQNGVLFIGSSSIRKWDLKKSFPDGNYINRGFGGSEIADSTHFAERIVIPYRPRVIALYAGDNDISRDKSPKQVAADFQEFVKTVHASLQSTKIVFIAIKPSIKRWNLVDKMREANRLVKAFTETDSKLVFVDIDKPMIGDDGQPRRELFVDDGLHLSSAGYELWSKLVRPHLK